MPRLRANNVFGTLDSPLGVPATANATENWQQAGTDVLPVASDDGSGHPSIIAVTLDPGEVNGPAEIVHIVSHSSGASSSTIKRGQEGTTARAHAAGTKWAVGPTALDFSETDYVKVESNEQGEDAIAVYVKSGYDSIWRRRFGIENPESPASGLVDTDLHSTVVNVGSETAATSLAGTKVVVRQPSGNSANLLEAHKAGSADAVVFAIDASGTVTISNADTAATAVALRIKARLDAQPRWQIDENGSQSWGPGGSTPVDAVLSRTGAGELTLVANLAVWGNASSTLEPTASSHLTTKSYVDAIATGLHWLETPVALATTAALTSLSGEQTIDGTLTSSSRVLVKDQTGSSGQNQPKFNGIWITGSGDWTRATDCDSATEIKGAAVFVSGGTTNANTSWTQTRTPATIATIASTTGDQIAWAQIAGATSLNAGTGLTKSGNTLSVTAGGIDTTQLANSAVTTAKIADANVTTGKIADDAVTADKLSYSGTASSTSYLGFDASGLLTVKAATSAAADGSTIVSGLTTTALNNAATAAGAGGTVIVPAGTYTMTGVLTIDKPGQKWIVHKGAEFVYNSPTLTGIKITADDVTWDGGQIDGANTYRGATLKAGSTTGETFVPVTGVTLADGSTDLTKSSHGFSEGDCVIVTGFTAASGGATPGLTGWEPGRRFFVRLIDGQPTKFRLSPSKTTTEYLTARRGGTCTVTKAGGTAEKSGISATSGSTTFTKTAHGFTEKQPVFATAGTGLGSWYSTSNRFYVHVLNANDFQLWTSPTSSTPVTAGATNTTLALSPTTRTSNAPTMLVDGADGVVIRNVDFDNVSYNAISAQSCDITIENCYVRYAGGTAIATNDSNGLKQTNAGITIRNNRIDRTGERSANGPWLGSYNHYTDGGIKVNGDNAATAFPIERVAILDNEVRQPYLVAADGEGKVGNECIVLQDLNIHNGIVAGNRCLGGTMGPSIANVSNVIVDHNVVVGASKNCIEIPTSKHVIVSNNVVDGHADVLGSLDEDGNAMDVDHHGIVVWDEATDVIVSGNVVRNLRDAWAGTKKSFGIKVQNAVGIDKRCIVAHNHVTVANGASAVFVNEAWGVQVKNNILRCGAGSTASGYGIRIATMGQPVTGLSVAINTGVWTKTPSHPFIDGTALAFTSVSATNYNTSTTYYVEKKSGSISDFYLHKSFDSAINKTPGGRVIPNAAGSGTGSGDVVYATENIEIVGNSIYNAAAAVALEGANGKLIDSNIHDNYIAGCTAGKTQTGTTTFLRSGWYDNRGFTTNSPQPSTDAKPMI